MNDTLRWRNWLSILQQIRSTTRSMVQLSTGACAPLYCSAFTIKISEER